MDRFKFSPDLLQIFHLANEKYKTDRNVFGIDIGYNYENGNRIESQCVRVHLGFDNNYSSENQLVKFISYANLGQRNTRRVLTRRQERTRKRDILQPGISIGSSDCGTLGLICFDELKGLAPSILSARHVLNGPIGMNVSQPGPGLDGGHLGFHAVAKIRRYDPDGDAAIATLNGRRNFDLEQFETGNLITNARLVKLGDKLIKSGRTTGVKEALVDGIGYYYKNFSNTRQMIQGFMLSSIDPLNAGNEEISDMGDSGAIWFDASSNEGLGLLFAGEKSTVAANLEFSLAQHLVDIVDRLNISLTC